MIRAKKSGAIEKDKPLDVFRFLFVALKHFPDCNFIKVKVDGFVRKIPDIKKGFTERELTDVLETHFQAAGQIAGNEKKR